MRTLSGQEMLRIWERGLGQHPVERALTMLSVAFPDVPRDALLALSVGQRDAYLLALREAAFGSQFSGFAQCQQCQERLEFTFDMSNVRVGAASLETLEQVQQFHVEGQGRDTPGPYEVHARLPNSTDLLAITACRSIAAARDILIQHCILHAFLNEDEVSRESLPESVVTDIGVQLVECDPQSEVDIALSCPACGHEWPVVFDIAAFLWVELQAYAKRLLRDVHTLATAYGWHEADILAMSAVRRQFYLEMVF
ncbi:MAG: hypothetical protein NVS4B9_32890 [Ktedonobacteraceae bacterium]